MVFTAVRWNYFLKSEGPYVQPGIADVGAWSPAEGQSGGRDVQAISFGCTAR